MQTIRTVVNIVTEPYAIVHVAIVVGPLLGIIATLSFAEKIEKMFSRS